jgi:hypothetical protein
MNVETIEGAWEKVKKMRGVSYNWIDKNKFGTQREIGFIAQELEKVVPEVVRNGGEYKSVNYQILTALLAEAIKEQQKEIDALKQVNVLVTAQNKAIEDKLDQLLKQVNKNNTATATLPATHSKK